MTERLRPDADEPVSFAAPPPADEAAAGAEAGNGAPLGRSKKRRGRGRTDGRRSVADALTTLTDPTDAAAPTDATAPAVPANGSPPADAAPTLPDEHPSPVAETGLAAVLPASPARPGPALSGSAPSGSASRDRTAGLELRHPGERAPSLPPAPSRARASSEAVTGDWELFLLRLRYREGRLVTISGNKPIVLDDPDVAWIVFSGYVEVFTVRAEAGEPVGARSHLFRATDGTALFGIRADTDGIRLLAGGAPGTQLLRVKRANLERLAANPEFGGLVAALVERWIDGVSTGLVRGLPPREFAFVEAGVELAVPRDGVARSKGGILWIAHLEGSSRLLGRPDAPLVNGTGRLPLAPQAWLQAHDEVRLDAVDTAGAFVRPEAWADLDRFNDLAQLYLARDVEQQTVDARDRLDDRTAADQARLDVAYAQLASILSPRVAEAWIDGDQRDALLMCCRMVGRQLGIAIVPPRAAAEGEASEEPLYAIARASRIHIRRVALRDAWWKGDSGPLIGYVEDGNRPVALIPTSVTSYDLYDPSTRTHRRVDARVAATLSPFATTFYRRFDDKALSAKDLFAFGARGCGKDITAIVLTGLAGGLLSLLIPMMTQVFFDQAIPGAQRGLVAQMTIGLILAAVASMLFQVAREASLLRLSGRMDAVIQAAVMDRMLNLPATFYRQYTAGDLGGRVLGISAIREIIAKIALSTMISGLFSLFSFGLLFYYDMKLALVATGMVVVLALVAFGALYFQVRHQRELGELGGRLAGVVLQLIVGVSKFRVAGAESRAFAYWAGRFGDQRRVGFKEGTIENGLETWNAVYPVVTTMIIFACVVWWIEPKPSTGTFLAFNAAFGQFVSGAISIIAAVTTVVQIVPMFERSKPILETLPEVDQSKVDPGELSGSIEIDHVTFRYSENGPAVLDDVSLHIRPGEFVALVGPSGSGKSTLLRLLLGFDDPESGAILYDGRDLASLDIRAVRRQIGSVLQNGRLMSGDIFTNIVGNSTLTLDDAWEAARMAGFDEDVRRMPMGMQTVVSEGGGTISGGQRQRLLISRAIVRRPRIIFFDEATSALDNRTQEIVSRSLEQLAATRVVISHRLSTIVNAYRIFVLQGGRIIESGTYRELLQRRGLFAELARRQIA